MHLCTMIGFPPAKLNLGLNVVERMNDGFHSIESVMIPVPIYDVLEIIRAEELKPGELKFDTSGIAIPGSLEDNLCIKAHRLFHERSALPGIHVHLFKNIPIGAGLGGGSSDCAYMLDLMNRLASSPLKHEELHELASTLGSDVPFFLTTGCQLAKGRGEILNKVDLDLTGYHCVIVNPGIHIDTSASYRDTKPSGKSLAFNNVILEEMSQWQGQLINSMEDSAFRVHPVLETIKRSLYAAGARFALMSGSGSTIYGLFDKEPGQLNWPKDYSSWTFGF